MKPQKTPPRSQLPNYARYSGIAVQMGVVIFAGVWGGHQLDKQLHCAYPLFTLLFSLVSVPLAIYFAVKDFIKKK